MSMCVDVPEGRSGNIEIRRIVAGPPGLYDMFHQKTRPIIPEGTTITALYRSGQLWMSDTPAEQRDHQAIMMQAIRRRARRVLINGLGLGMVVGGLIQLDHVNHIDVVELDTDVIDLVGDHYQRMADNVGKTVEIHHGDAYTISWPAGSRWDVAWSDIWQYASIDNLVDMARLSRRYSGRVGWHGHWLRETLLTHRGRVDREQQQRSAWFAANRGRALWPREI
jgi:hypothetical protein